MTYQKTLLYLLLIVSTLSFAEAQPKSSPAGGNYLVLDGVDDYAVLDFQTFGILLPKGTDEFTVEAWVYPTTAPNRNTMAVMLSQQVRMRVAGHGNPSVRHIKDIVWAKDDLLLITDAHVAGWGGDTVTPFFPITISPNRWHHIAFQAKGRETTTIVNHLSRTMPQGTRIGHDLSKFWRPKDFVLGGFGTKIRPPNVGNSFWSSFAGYIDEVRISTVARYDVTKRSFTPRGKFLRDKKTIALWHFDEPGGTRRFSDASDNLYHLVGKNGGKLSAPLGVNTQKKIATTWGAVKHSDLVSRR